MHKVHVNAKVARVESAAPPAILHINYATFQRARNTSAKAPLFKQWPVVKWSTNFGAEGKEPEKGFRSHASCLIRFLSAGWKESRWYDNPQEIHQVTF